MGEQEDEEEDKKENLVALESPEAQETRAILAEMKRLRHEIKQHKTHQEEIREAAIAGVRQLVNDLKREKARSAELRNRSTGMGGKLEILATGAAGGASSPPTTVERWLERQSVQRGKSSPRGTKDAWTLEKQREADRTSTVQAARLARMNSLKNSRDAAKDLIILRSTRDSMAQEVLHLEAKTADLKLECSQQTTKLEGTISVLKSENNDLQNELDSFEKSLRQIVTLAIR